MFQTYKALLSLKRAQLTELLVGNDLLALALRRLIVELATDADDTARLMAYAQVGRAAQACLEAAMAEEVA